MAERGTWVRAHRRMGSEPGTAYLSGYAQRVLLQIQNIAADEGDVTGPDILIPTCDVTPERVALEIGRHPEDTVERIAAAFEDIRKQGLIVAEDLNTMRVVGVAETHADRFRRRLKERQRRKGHSEADQTPTVPARDGTCPTVPDRAGVVEAVTGSGAGTATTPTPPSADVGEPRVVPRAVAVDDNSLREDSAGARARPAARRKNPMRGLDAITLGVEDIRRWFAARYVETQGTPYVQDARKDAAAVRKVLSAGMRPDELRERLERGLTTDADPWLSGTARGLTLLCGQVNKPALRGIEPAAKPWDSRYGSAATQPTPTYQNANVDLGAFIDQPMERRT